eukprot:1490342-Pleurochrysis_carterae.AAC.1
MDILTQIVYLLSIPKPISPRQSKSNARGEVWGKRPMALAYANVPGNAARALAQHLELAFPVYAGAR